MEIRNARTGKVKFEATTMDISDDGAYDLGSFTFQEPYAENIGPHILQVVLFDSNFNQIAAAEKTFTYRDVNRYTVIIKHQVAPYSFELANGGVYVGGEVLLRETEVHEEGTDVTYSAKEIPGYRYDVSYTHYEGDRMMKIRSAKTITSAVDNNLEIVFTYVKI